MSRAEFEQEKLSRENLEYIDCKWKTVTKEFDKCKKLMSLKAYI